MKEEDGKLKIIMDFYDLTMKGQNEMSKVEMTDFLMRKIKFEKSKIPEKLFLLRRTYMTEYFIQECSKLGLIEGYGIQRVNQIIRMKIG